MYDIPEKSQTLLRMLKASLPFDVHPAAEIIRHLAGQPTPLHVRTTETVIDVHYSGDTGGMLLARVPEGADRLLLMALTHVRVPRSHPFFTAVYGYQKHRTKKIRKFDGGLSLTSRYVEGAAHGARQ